MAEEDEIAALVIDNGSGMCKGGLNQSTIGTVAAGIAMKGFGWVCLVDQPTTGSARTGNWDLLTVDNVKALSISNPLYLISRGDAVWVCRDRWLARWTLYAER